MNILWLDDDFESFQYTFETVMINLGKHKYRITPIETPSQLMDEINQSDENLNVIILDVLMKYHEDICIDDINFNTNFGYEAGRILYDNFLSKHKKTKNIPVIFYTNIENDHLFNQWLSQTQKTYKNVWYLPKSCDQEKLIEKILEVCNKGNRC